MFIALIFHHFWHRSIRRSLWREETRGVIVRENGENQTEVLRVQLGMDFIQAAAITWHYWLYSMELKTICTMLPKADHTR